MATAGSGAGSGRNERRDVWDEEESTVTGIFYVFTCKGTIYEIHKTSCDCCDWTLADLGDDDG